jgi:hypothetical protein
MAQNNFKGFSIVVFIAIISLIAALPGCNRVKVVPPPPLLMAPYPLEVTSDELGLAYLADPVAADAKYKGNEIWITITTVADYVTDQNSYCVVSTLPTTTQIYDDSHDRIIQILDVMAVDCKIISLHYPQQFSVGDMVEVVGICQGIQDGNIRIDISIINKIGAAIVQTGINMSY